jgi:soluble lytic murein transglycosylase-like protein
MIKYLSPFLMLIVFLSFAGPSSAGIYKYVDQNGVIHFTNSPTDPQYRLYLREQDDVIDKKELASKDSLEPQGQPAILRSIDSTIYDALIAQLSKKYDVDFHLVKAIIRAESGFNPYAISRKGARGLMQLMPETAQRMNVSNIFDPKDNIDGGVRYFKYLLSLFNNDLRLSLAAYNAGENIVAQVKGIPPYRETIYYVKKVLVFYQSYKP